MRWKVIIVINSYFILRYFNFEPSFKLRWCRARDSLGLQIPVTAGGFEQRISCIRCFYLTHQVSGLVNDFVCKRFAVQTLLWSLEFVILINLEYDTIATLFCDKMIEVAWNRMFSLSSVFICFVAKPRNTCIMGQL